MDEEVKEFVVTQSEAEELRDLIRNATEEKGIDNFFLGIIRDDNSLKIGNLTEEELGMPQIPLRSMIDLASDCEKIPALIDLGNDLKKQAQNLIASSLSKEGFLIKSRITQKKEFADTKKKRVVKKGLFGSKEVEE